MPTPKMMAISAIKGRLQEKMKTKGVAGVEELRDSCLEAGVGMTACQMTVDLFDYKQTDLIDGIDYAGAATFFEFAGGLDICLYI